MRAAGAAIGLDMCLECLTTVVGMVSSPIMACDWVGTDWGQIFRLRENYVCLFEGQKIFFVTFFL